MDRVQLFKQIVDDMSELYARKNHDYGDSFTQTVDEFGLVAPAIRLSDKLNRFKSLIKSPSQVTDEKLEDTLIDMASYAIMTVIWLKGHDLSGK
jgi:hypothetical protein